TLEKGQQTLEKGQQTLEKGQQTLEKGQQTLEKGQQTLEKGQQTLEKGQQALEKGQLNIEIRLENEVIEKIRALFDGWQAHEEKFARIINTLDDISIDVRYLVARVVKLEKLAK
ncbi:MAG: hypothetical protein C4589_03545, partial [Peptococcaceae bacterium]